MENEENVDLVENTEVQGQETEQQQPKTYSEEELTQRLEEQKKQINEDNQKAWNKRWGREKSKIEKANAKQNELVKLLQEQTQTDSIDDLLEVTYQNYGVERPIISNPKDDEVLGQYDAKEILALDDVSIEEEANRLAGMERTAREQATFMELSKYLTNKKQENKRKQEIQEAGIDDETLNNEEFKTFVSKFRDDVSLKDIYEDYKKMQPVKEKPYTAGSAKGTNKSNKNEVKEFYTYEESLKFTREDFDRNPELFKAVSNSMLKWGK
jgi:hypothetical protein